MYLNLFHTVVNVIEIIIQEDAMLIVIVQDAARIVSLHNNYLAT